MTARCRRPCWRAATCVGCVGLLCSELVQGIPAVFPRLVDKIPSVHAVFVFVVSIKHLPIPHVAAPERFVYRRVGPVSHHVFRCVARYGYTDPMVGGARNGIQGAMDK